MEATSPHSSAILLTSSSFSSSPTSAPLWVPLTSVSSRQLRSVASTQPGSVKRLLLSTHSRWCVCSRRKRLSSGTAWPDFLLPALPKSQSFPQPALFQAACSWSCAEISCLFSQWQFHCSNLWLSVELGLFLPPSTRLLQTPLKSWPARTLHLLLGLSQPFTTNTQMRDLVSFDQFLDLKLPQGFFFLEKLIIYPFIRTSTFMFLWSKCLTEVMLTFQSLLFFTGWWKGNDSKPLCAVGFCHGQFLSGITVLQGDIPADQNKHLSFEYDCKYCL